MTTPTPEIVRTTPMSIPDQLVKAIALQGEGHLEAAELLFESVLADDPGNAHALYSLSLLHMNSARAQTARQLCQRGIAAAPTFAPLHYLHGVLLQNQGDKEGALRSYDAALALRPDYTEVLLNSGALLRSMFRHKDALARFNQILGIQPDHAGALGNCGIMLTEFKQSEQAIAMFQRLIKVNPAYDFGLGLLFYERLHICDWTDFDALSAQIVDGVRAGRRVCKSLAFMSASDQGRDHLLAARIFAQAYAPVKPEPLWRGETYHHDRVRLAYVSPDFREHPVGHLMAGVFERHDRSKFQTIAISLGMDDNSRLRARMLGAFDTFIDAHDMGSEQIARLMRDMEVDIAVDLGGYTSDTRTEVFAWRPAPVQVNYLGYPGTMGTRYFDYILADRHVIPPEHQDFYDEKVAYLPDAYLPTDDSVRISETTPTRSDCGLPDTGIVFCAFSHDYKICPPMFSVWMRLLTGVPGSVLWLASRSETTRDNLRREARERGIDPARLVFAGRVPLVEDHLARYRQADIFLDTYPYNAHTTAADALMAGLPVVTCSGHAFPARVAGSLLHAVGLPELVTNSLADYEALALSLAAQPERLSAVKAKLALSQGTHALFDTERFCRNLERSLLAMTHAAAPSASTPEPTPQVADTALDVAERLISTGNIPQAELQLRLYLRSGGNSPRAVRLLAQVTHGYGLPPHFRLSEKNRAPGEANRYLFIRDWGYGFWSNVHHVLGQLLVAELTGRVPVVWWGENSLFRDAANPNAFALFFQPVVQNGTVLPPVTDLSIYPPKWNATNLHGAAVNAWEGPYSRMAAPFLFDRPEDMVVSDFYAPLSAIIPWIGADSAYHGLDEDELYLRLCEKYLRPAPAISKKAEDFFAQRMASRAWVAVHVRGSDKIHESPHLHQTNERYIEFIDQIIALNPGIGVFLLTDAVDVFEAYQARYGSRLLTTPALRTGSQIGVHLQGHPGYAVGADVLIDVLLAIRCQYFLGNKESNVSLAVSSLKRWPAGFIFMFGDKSVRSDNWFLHHGHMRPAQELGRAGPLNPMPSLPSAHHRETEGKNVTPAAKRVIQVFKAPHQWINSPPGLGDFVRGVCHLVEKLRGSGVELRVDVSQTGFATLIEPDPTVFQTGDPQRIASAQEYFVDHVALHERLVAFLHSAESELYVCTNVGAWNRASIPDDARAYARKFYRFIDAIEQTVAQALPAPHYEVLSVRCGDQFYSDPGGRVHTDIEPVIFSIIERQILPRLRFPLVVTSDCHELKLELQKRYGMHALPHRSQHGAFESDSARPVVMDMCMLKHSRFNHHINTWASWWSGFSHYTSVIFQIPSANFRAPAFLREEISSQGELSCG